MAARLLHQGASPAVAALLIGTVLYPRVAFAETPDFARKPIYDDYDETPTSATLTKTKTTAPLTPAESAPARATRPTPTDRLAGHIRTARLFLYRQTCAAEDGVNRAADKVFGLERSLTETVASLAPAKETGERLLPGAVYVLVAAMAGSIVTRRSNIVLRAAVPVAFAATAGWQLLPVTMRNVANLAWTYEQRVPSVAQAHLQARAALDQTASMARTHAAIGKAYADDKVAAVRASVEGWVKQGK